MLTDSKHSSSPIRMSISKVSNTGTDILLSYRLKIAHRALNWASKYGLFHFETHYNADLPARWAHQLHWSELSCTSAARLTYATRKLHT